MNHQGLVPLSISFALAAVMGCGKPQSGQHAAKTQTAATTQTAKIEIDQQAPVGTVLPASYRTTDAESFLEAVFTGYRKATSYHDRGRVRLTTTENGKRIERVAPMSMWMQSTDVDLVAYDVRVTIENSIMQAWVSDPASDDMDSQVLHIPLPLRRGRPSLDAALTDPILAGRLGAGMAGPPPQLEWLFAKDPMAGLFRGDHQFQFLADQRIDNRLCRCVRVLVPEQGVPEQGSPDNRMRMEYRFYIDAEDHLVRQVDLPTIHLPDLQGKTKQAKIRIELSAASFRPPSRRRVRNGYPESPKRVKRFVPVPLPPPSRSSDVPAELLEEWREQVRDYQAALKQVQLIASQAYRGRQN